ncbi:MAG: GNAT family N-acetyltransferase [Gemmatimonadota bacterium]|nr:GNAT family N-acetyltransferase [Gemmatimonadota bacterium]
MSVRVVPYSADHADAWSAFVDAHPHRAVGHLTAVFEVERVGSSAINRSVLLEENGKLRGVVPLFERRWKNLRFFGVRELSSGSYFRGGPLFDAALSERHQRHLLKELAAYLDEQAAALGVDQVSISFPTVIGERPAVEVYGYLPLRHYGFRETGVVALLADLRSDEDTLFGKLERSRRIAISRCRASGGEVQPIETRDEWLGAYELNVQTLGDKAYSREALAVMWDRFVAEGHAAALGVYASGALASVELVTTVGTSAYSWCGFRAHPAPVAHAGTLGLWEAMLLCKRRGIPIFEFGSLEFDSPKQIGIGAFKASFGPRPVYALGGVRSLRPMRDALLHVARASVAFLRSRIRPHRRGGGPAV